MIQFEIIAIRNNNLQVNSEELEVYHDDMVKMAMLLYGYFGFVIVLGFRDTDNFELFRGVWLMRSDDVDRRHR